MICRECICRECWCPKRNVNCPLKTSKLICIIAKKIYIYIYLDWCRASRHKKSKRLFRRQHPIQPRCNVVFTREMLNFKTQVYIEELWYLAHTQVCTMLNSAGPLGKAKYNCPKWKQLRWTYNTTCTSPVDFYKRDRQTVSCHSSITFHKRSRSSSSKALLKSRRNAFTNVWLWTHPRRERQRTGLLFLSGENRPHM